jgi:GNAT superfamily N-acetyltransferase
MHWYEKLAKYFPVEEMKSKEHMEALLSELPNIYHSDIGPKHVMFYAELDGFIFVDYLLVSKEARGEGLGHKLIEKLKKKQKPIILEVEPFNYEDSDTGKRLRFYKREDFKHAESIVYKTRSLSTHEDFPMEILYWAPNDESEEMIFEAMKEAYNKIHTYKDTYFYGEAYQPAEVALTFNQTQGHENILENL